MNDAHLWHPWLRINRVLRVMLHTHWSAEAWPAVRIEFRRAVAFRSQIRREKSTDRFSANPVAGPHHHHPECLSWGPKAWLFKFGEFLVCQEDEGLRYALSGDLIQLFLNSRKVGLVRGHPD